MMTSAVTRRSVRIGLVAVGVVLAVLVSGVVALPSIVRWAIVRQVAAQTGRQVAIDTADVSLFRGRVDLRNFRVVDHDGGPLITFERLDIRFRPLDLLRGHVRIVDATLAAPTIRIVRLAPRQFNVSDLVRPGGTGPGRLGFTIDRLVVRDGSITLEDRTSTPARSWPGSR